MQKKPGAKRKAADIRRKMVALRLPPAIIDFLRRQELSQSQVIIEALKKCHKELRG